MKNKKGITLIALVITIIILLILAGVAISQLSESGLFNKTQKASEVTKYTSAKEQVILKITEVSIECTKNKQELTYEKIALSVESDLKINLDMLYEVKTESSEILYKKVATISDGMSMSEETKLDGLVVSSNDYPEYKFLIGKEGNTFKAVKALKGKVTKDTTKDEFYEIQTFEDTIIKKDAKKDVEKDVEEEKITEYPGMTAYKDKSGKIARIPNGFTASNVSGENEIEKGLVIRDQNGNEFVWIPVENYETFIQDNDFKSSSYSDDVTEDNYKAMIASIQKYKGFYIGRYEAGQVNVSKRNEKTAISQTKSSAQALCLNYSNDVIAGSLMYGVQWDAVLRFIAAKEPTYNLTNSYNWGNYNENSKTFIGYGCESYGSNIWSLGTESRTETYLLIGTGLVEQFKVLNIYDFAGNIIELTLEGSGVGRGGGHQDDGQGNYSASGRTTDGRMGYRLSFYLK